MMLYCIWFHMVNTCYLHQVTRSWIQPIFQAMFWAIRPSARWREQRILISTFQMIRFLGRVCAEAKLLPIYFIEWPWRTEDCNLDPRRQSGIQRSTRRGCRFSHQICGNNNCSRKSRTAWSWKRGSAAARQGWNWATALGHLEMPGAPKPVGHETFEPWTLLKLPETRVVPM